MKRQKVKIIEEKEEDNFLMEFLIWVLTSLGIFLGGFIIVSIIQWVFGVYPFDQNVSSISSFIGTIGALCFVLSNFSSKKRTIECEKVVFIEGVNDEDSN